MLAFVVLLTGVAIAYLSRTTSDRQVAHSSFNQSSVDGLAQSAMDTIIGDLRQEIVNGSTATTVSGVTIYTPTSAANMVPQRSGNAAGAPNLIRRSWSGDTNLSVRSRASAVNSRTDVSANGRYITSTRWNGHYLVPKGNTATDDSSPIPAFTAATPDWVFVTGSGAARINQPSAAVLGRYAYAVYDEGGLLDMNVAGYPTGTSAIQSGRKGSIAFADLKALGSYPIPNPSSGSPQIYQIDQLVGWRNYGTISPTPSNNFPDITPAAQAFAKNFQTDSAPATAFFNFVANNTNGFLTTSAVVNASGRTDQMFTSRQELIAFKKIAQFATSFNVNSLQYVSTFSRETNSPSFSPSTPAGSTIDYAALARTSTAVNPNFLLRRVTNVPNGYTRFDGTTPVAGEPLVKTRFPLSRLAWITYKGPSALLATSDPVYQALINAGVGPATISTGTAANITRCFGLQFGGAAGNPSFPWVYTNPTGTVAAPASRILRLDEVAAVGREADFFELLGAGILSGSLGQNTSGGVTGGNVFPDVHMSNTTHHILSIGAAIIDQADPDSIPTRIQFSPSGTVWTAYGVENLPYITQLYPIAGTSPDTPTRWATYLLFQLWNPHQSPADVANKVRLRIDGGIGIFAGGNGQAWNTANTVNVYPPVGQVTSVTITKSASFPTPAPLATDYTSVTSTAQGTFAFLPTPAVPTPTP
ncbi:MAG: hypothetical protein DME87_13780 [Verrucomicrobia bacterium]|nr:MAG: hypothetical protein DME87_13780 [Verrucomicrobiota bacterium]